MGRFLTRDTWPGEVNRPLSLNRWGYVEANPVNLTDPSGKMPSYCVNWPNKSSTPVWIGGQLRYLDRDLCLYLDKEASLDTIEEFYRTYIVNGLRLQLAFDAANLLLYSLDGKTAPYELSLGFGLEIMSTRSHQNALREAEMEMLRQIRPLALALQCDQTIPFGKRINRISVDAYADNSASTNVRYGLGGYSVSFAWDGEITRKASGWIVTGEFGRDIADYSDWHGAPGDYLGNGTNVCPEGDCNKTASITIPFTNEKIVIPDDWMARLVLSGKASNPGFAMYFNTKEFFFFHVPGDDWGNRNHSYLLCESSRLLSWQGTPRIRVRLE
jgi:hypothetical protein